MKKIGLLLFGLVGILVAVYSLSGPRVDAKAATQESPLKYANTVIPELMGVPKAKKRLDVSPDMTAKLELAKSFRTYLETTYLRLPSIEKLKLSKNGDLHHVPTEVIESSEIFGDIADKIKNNSTLIMDALKFYSACSLNDQLITSVRAVCARNLQDWAKTANINISRVEIPENILKIADVLPRRN
ncbi:MAG: hypothetical protein EXR74_05500 [Bdellovibrionales bacterium]|nr:hypothetical protein [Bdellovibrionales bacterium]